MSAKVKITVAFGLLLSIVIWTLSSINYWSFQQSSTSNYKEKLEIEAGLLTKSVKEHMDRIFDVLHVASDNISYTAEGDFSTEDNMKVLQSIVGNIDVINAYSAVGSGITYSTSTNGRVSGFNAKDKKREWFYRAFNGEDYILTKPYTSAEGDAVMAAAVPVKRNGVVVGVLCVNLSIDKITRFIDTLVDDNKFYFTNAEGYVISSMSSEDIGGNIFSIVPAYANVKSSIEGGGHYMHEGEEYFYSSVSMDVLGWKTWAWDKVENINSDSRSTLLMSFAIGALLLSLSLLIIYFIVIRLVYRPVGGEPESIKRIVKDVSSGNLNLHSERSESKVDTGIYYEVVKMAGSLRSIVARIELTSSSVHDASEDISRTADVVSQSSEAQMNQLEQTSSAMTEMTATIQEVARNAQDAATAANSASVNSEQGITIINEVTHNVTTLRDGIVNVQSSILGLAEETNSIGKILDVIQGVAEQTNLLALNAAIEAARAGEQGRGFAVVADEVRDLASRTQANTNEIQDLIHRLQAQAAASVQLMEENSRYVELTFDKSNTANSTLTEIFESMAVISDMNSQIAAASEQQSLVASEISTSIIAINDLAKDTFEQTRVNAGKSDELNQSSKELALVVDEFKL